MTKNDVRIITNYFISEKYKVLLKNILPKLEVELQGIGYYLAEIINDITYIKTTVKETHQELQLHVYQMFTHEAAS